MRVDNYYFTKRTLLRTCTMLSEILPSSTESPLWAYVPSDRTPFISIPQKLYEEQIGESSGRSVPQRLIYFLKHFFEVGSDSAPLNYKGTRYRIETTKFSILYKEENCPKKLMLYTQIDNAAKERVENLVEKVRRLEERSAPEFREAVEEFFYILRYFCTLVVSIKVFDPKSYEGFIYKRYLEEYIKNWQEEGIISRVVYTDFEKEEPIVKEAPSFDYDDFCQEFNLKFKDQISSEASGIEQLTEEQEASSDIPSPIVDGYEAEIEEIRRLEQHNLSY